MSVLDDRGYTKNSALLVNLLKTAFFSFLDFAIYEMVDSNTIWRSISLQKLVLEQE